MVLDPNISRVFKKSNCLEGFLSNNGKWFVIFNERNQLPHRAFGSPIAIK